MNILLTGGTGFIGSSIKEYFLNSGYNIIELIRNNKICDQLSASESIKYDITNSNYNDIISKLKGKDIKVIIHSAAAIESNFESDKLLRTNCLGTNNLIKISKDLKIKKFIYLSSLPIIGKPINIPITEEHPIKTESIYHLSKYFGEHLISIQDPNLFIGTILRISAPVGPNMPKERFLSYLIQNCLNNKEITLLGKGERIQNYVHVNDIARLIENCIKKSSYGVFNVAGPSSISNIDLTKLCIARTRSKSNYRFTSDDPHEGYKWIVSSAKTKKILGYSPEMNIKNMVDEQIMINKKLLSY